MKGKPTQVVGDWVRQRLKTAHGRVMLLGWLVVACYLPLWFVKLGKGMFAGSGSIFTASALCLGLFHLWQQRQKLATLEAPEADRWLGYFLIGMALLLFPLGFSTFWIQRVVWLQIFAGMALSSWGGAVFTRFPVPIFLVVLGLFPEPSTIIKTFWNTFLPPESLERLMAWSGTLALKAIGQPATLVDPVSIALPGGAVKVGPPCSGFDMALVLGVASLVVGLALGETIAKVALMVVIGVALALLANVPRIMLLAMSEAYWGKPVFDFWHGFWGGQIFAGTIFTIYYYIVMALRKRKGSPSSAR